VLEFENLSSAEALDEVEYALSQLGAVLGRDVHDDVITRIFSRFCVGK